MAPLPYRVGEVVELSQGSYVHLQHISGGSSAYVDSFMSMNTQVTGDHALVVIKTPRVERDNPIFELEEEILTMMGEVSENFHIQSPVIKIFDSGIYKKKKLLVLEHMQTSLDAIIKERVVLADECVSSATKIFTLCRDFHRCGYAHLDVKPENVLINFETDGQKKQFLLMLIQAALLENTVTGVARVALRQAEEVLVEAGLHPEAPEILSLTPIQFKLADVNLSVPANTVPRETPGTWTYLPPESLLSGDSSVKVDIYSTCLTVAELAVGTPVFSAEAKISDKQLVHSLLAQMKVLKGDFSKAFLDKTEKSEDFFNRNGTLKKPQTVVVGSPLHTLLESQLEEEHGWFEEEKRALYKVLSLGLRHNPTSRGSFTTLLSKLPN